METVSLPSKVGFLRQNIQDYQSIKVIDAVIMGNEKLWEALTERDRLYEQEMTDEVGMRLGDLEEIVANEDGYTAESDAEIFLVGMGIPAEHHEKLLGELPTDIQFRVMLCQALFGNPEALLLDEPTNHLDLESIGWLETFLHEFTGTLIVVSHDRHFLNTVTTHIADIDYDTIITYPGNYDDMLIAKTQVRARQEAENKSKEKKISDLKEFVSKFGAGTRASQVQSRVREINRLQPQDLKKSNIDRPFIRFPSPEKKPGKSIFRVDHLAKSFDDIEVFKNFSFEIMQGDTIGVIGSNGAGKTTLLKLLAEEIAPDSGSIEKGHEVNTGYFPQNHEDLIDKNSDINGFDWLKSQKSQVYDQEIRGVLGKMLFPGEDAFKEVSKLSGGETARLIIAMLMLKEHNVLILDEPNNHLDLESVSALCDAVSEFKGTSILASHDRTLIGETANKIIALEPSGPIFFQGTLEEYLASQS